MMLFPNFLVPFDQRHLSFFHWFLNWFFNLFCRFESTVFQLSLDSSPVLAHILSLDKVVHVYKFFGEFFYFLSFIQLIGSFLVCDAGVLPITISFVDRDKGRGFCKLFLGCILADAITAIVSDLKVVRLGCKTIVDTDTVQHKVGNLLLCFLLDFKLLHWSLLYHNFYVSLPTKQLIVWNRLLPLPPSKIWFCHLSQKIIFHS